MDFNGIPATLVGILLLGTFCCALPLEVKGHDCDFDCDDKCNDIDDFKYGHDNATQCSLCCNVCDIVVCKDDCDDSDDFKPGDDDAPVCNKCCAAKTIGVVKLVEAIGSGVTGTLTVVQSVNSPEVTITGRISNLAPGKHGFHIHVNGTTANNCLDAGLHYNPTEMSHGSPLSSTRHVGDLGNIVTPYSAGITTVSITDSIISLEGIMGRAVVVHEDADDFVTPETGGAGARLSCGVIESCDLNCQKTLWETLKKLEGDKGHY